MQHSTNVNIEEKEALIRGEDSVGLVAGLVDNMKGMVGDKWSVDEKAKMKEATEEVLNRQGDGFRVDLNGEKAVRMVAWIALPQRFLTHTATGAHYSCGVGPDPTGVIVTRF